MIPILKRLFVCLCLLCIVGSCMVMQNEDEDKNELPNSNIYVAELTQEQQAAFDALNTLQTSTDEKNRLYSTFPNIKQPCYPADTSFEVSQLELQHFMKKFIEQHCQNLTLEHQLELTKSSVLAQQQYTVWYCKEENSMVNYKKGIPMTGTWVMPNVLGRRDVILVW